MSHAHHAALSIIAAVAGRRPERLSGGNCGTFASGAAWALQERGYLPTLCFVCNADATSLEELDEGDHDLNHVLFELEGRLYHGHGEISVEEVIAWSGANCGEASPSLLRDLPNGCGATRDDALVMRSIRSNTNWSRSSSDYLGALQEVLLLPGPRLQSHADILPLHSLKQLPQGGHLTSTGRVDAMSRFASFELRLVDIKQMDCAAHPVHADVVQAYAGLSTPLPPIVVDLPRFVILDGIQRAQAALLRGQTEMLAYCGLKRTLADAPVPKASRRKALATSV